MKGRNNLKTIEDYREEIKEVERQMDNAKSYRKYDLKKYLCWLKREVKRFK